MPQTDAMGFPKYLLRAYLCSLRQMVLFKSPKDSGLIDFAYAIHTPAESAKLMVVAVPLIAKLKTDG